MSLGKMEVIEHPWQHDVVLLAEFYKSDQTEFFITALKQERTRKTNLRIAV
jgi:hypothetical protein